MIIKSKPIIPTANQFKGNTIGLTVPRVYYSKSIRFLQKYFLKNIKRVLFSVQSDADFGLFDPYRLAVNSRKRGLVYSSSI